MRQTLFFIPHELFGVDLFGWGLLLAVWLVFAVGLAIWVARREGLPGLVGYLPFLLLVAAAIVFVFPMLEARTPKGEPLGLPIRGYGSFVLIGFVSGVWLAMYRAAQRGIVPETITTLAVWMLVAAFVGARLFFVIEYWEEFRQESLGATLGKIIKVTEGGLVVYGALIAGLVALAMFSWRHHLSPLVMADIVAPALALGLAFGRLGCLMNGCCYGGVCEGWPVGIAFPRYNSVIQHSVSPPYQHQQATGRLHGFHLEKHPTSGAPFVKTVEAGSAAAQAGLTEGSSIRAINQVPTPNVQAAMQVLADAGPGLRIETMDGRAIVWNIQALPPQSRPVHPIQVYSALNAFLLLCVVLATEPYLQRSGATFLLTMILYAPVRFLEEVIRADEPGQFGTGLTISQLISLIILVALAGIFVYLRPWDGKGTVNTANPAGSA